MTLSAVSAIDIITDSLQKLGIYAPNEILSDFDAQLGLRELNAMIDDWLADSIYLYQLVSISVPLQVGMASYTIGPGAMVDVPRPRRIVVGRGVVPLTIGATVSYIDSVSAVEWNAIYDQANNSTVPVQGAPAVVCYDPQNPLGLLSVSPLPAAFGTLAISGLYGLPGFASLAAKYTLAPGGEKGLKANLALALNPYFDGGAVEAELLAEAQQSKTTLSITNRLSRAMAKRDREPPARGATPR